MKAQMHAASALYNRLEPHCETCKAVNRVYLHDVSEAETVMPEDLGSGFYRKILFPRSMRLSVTDIRFHRKMVLHGGGTPPKSQYNLLFCLGDDLEWHSGALARNCALHEGEAIPHQGVFVNGRWVIPTGFRLTSVELSFDEGTLHDLLPEMSSNTTLSKLLAGKDTCGPLRLSGSLLRPLTDIVSCRLEDTPRRLYLEAKSLELFALYLQERTGESLDAFARVSLSRTDMQRIKQARALIDADIGNAPSLRALARMAGVNECKLKAGFKALFGMPVHAYVIDRRLDTARLLLERGGLDVTTAAQSVGYTELGYFSRRFRDKFGFNPSEYRKRARESLAE